MEFCAGQDPSSENQEQIERRLWREKLKIGEQEKSGKRSLEGSKLLQTFLRRFFSPVFPFSRHNLPHYLLVVLRGWIRSSVDHDTDGLALQTQSPLLVKHYVQLPNNIP